MPSLRERLKSPVPWLVAVLGIVLSLLLDARREPERQVSAGLYVAGVHLYQRVGRPLLDGRVRCRYVPTCSEYSIQAVERRGILGGLALTVGRLSRCTRSVPPGTLDLLDLHERTARTHRNVARAGSSTTTARMPLLAVRRRALRGAHLGPLLDRIDLHVECRLSHSPKLHGNGGEPSAAVVQRAAAERLVQRLRSRRGRGSPLNAGGYRSSGSKRQRSM